jgi:hypothetical protein
MVNDLRRQRDEPFSPNSTNRRIASDSFGSSGCLAAHLRIAARKAGVPRNPISGTCPVAGRPLFFCLTSIAPFICFVYKIRGLTFGRVAFFA